MSAYIEIVMLDNLLMDYLLLWATGLFFIPEPKKLRLWMAAFIGMFYAVLAPMRSFLFLLHPIAKICMSLLLVLTAFGYKDWRKYLKQLAVFWLISMCVGGLVSGLGNVVGTAEAVNGVMAISGPPLWALLLLAFIATKLYEHLFHSFRRRSAVAGGVAELSFEMGGKDVTINGFFDTGNTAHDPLSGLPAIIVSLESLTNIGVCIDENTMDEMGFNLVIPYKGLTDGGVMRGFIPGQVCIKTADNNTIEARSAVAFVEKVEGFDALIPSSLTISLGEGKYAV